jgi:hypothetical protein
MLGALELSADSTVGLSLAGGRLIVAPLPRIIYGAYYAK